MFRSATSYVFIMAVSRTLKINNPYAVILVFYIAGWAWVTLKSLALWLITLIRKGTGRKKRL